MMMIMMMMMTVMAIQMMIAWVMMVMMTMAMMATMMMKMMTVPTDSHARWWNACFQRPHLTLDGTHSSISSVHSRSEIVDLGPGRLRRRGSRFNLGREGTQTSHDKPMRLRWLR